MLRGAAHSRICIWRVGQPPGPPGVPSRDRNEWVLRGASVGPGVLGVGGHTEPDPREWVPALMEAAKLSGPAVIHWATRARARKANRKLLGVGPAHSAPHKLTIGIANMPSAFL